MSRLFFGNFEFEHHLAAAATSTLPAALQRINAELAIGWWPLLQPGDRIWLPGSFEQEFLEPLRARGLTEPQFAGPGSTLARDLRLVPWGWTPAVEAWAARCGWRCERPGADAVRTANSRQFSFDLESRWHVGLESAATIHSPAELEHALEELAKRQRDWVLKAEFGMASRECLRGTGGRLEAAQLQWAKSRLSRGQVLILEPWVDRVAEMGLQFEIPPRSSPSAVQGARPREEPRFLGCVPLLSGAQGNYEGSRLPGGSAAAIDDRWQPAIEVAGQAARAVQELGYFGPLGIDAMLYRGRDGNVGCRPLQDINARFTMGRLAWEWNARLRPEGPASWLHVRWGRKHAESPRDWYKQMCDRLPPGVQAFRTAPFDIDGRPTDHGSVLVVAGSQPDLRAAERAFLDPHEATSTSGE